MFYRGLENFPVHSGQRSIVTVGTFDGIHRGHQAILSRVQSEAERLGCEAVMVTFHPHPRIVVTPNDIPMLLTTIEEKEKFVPHFFSGRVMVLNFDEELKKMTAEKFVEDILLKHTGMTKLVVGHDHAFGRNREGNAELLKKLGEKHGFEVEVVGPVLDNEKPISSSRIRRAIENNQYGEAIDLLGHAYAIYGKVERGIGLGRKLGYPTANVAYSQRKLLPVEGVYSCWAQIGDECKDGMMFIGRNHFNPSGRITVEANLFDFDQDIYDEELIVYATHYVRPNRKFDSTDALVVQIEKDKEEILAIIKKEKEDVDRQDTKRANHF
jgi:riboflavin kinase/FMN adenylyltransferase